MHCRSYRNMGLIKKHVPNVPVMAVTATATPMVERDICKSLSLRNPKLTRSTFDRPNLYLDVRLKVGKSLRLFGTGLPGLFSSSRLILRCLWARPVARC